MHNQSFIEPSILADVDPYSSEYSGFLDCDTSFDFDQQQFGVITPHDADSKDLHEKRKHSDADSDDEGVEHEGDAKRQEGEDKQAKRSGRKPATAEPTTVSSDSNPISHTSKS